MSIENKTLKEFTNNLASKSPTPGGGSVAALQGALGCGLTAMVCDLTIGKEKYKQYEKHNQNILKASINKKNGFLKLIDKDMQAYGQMKGCFALPKNTENEKKLRKAELQRVFKECAIPPYQMIILAGQALEDILSVVGKSNSMAGSDLGCAATNLYSCMQNAWLNVKVNLNCIDDENFVSKITKEAKNLLEKYKPIAEKIYNSCL